MGSKFDWWQFVDSSGANFLIQMNVALGVAGGGMASQHGDGAEVDVEVLKFCEIIVEIYPYGVYNKRKRRCKRRWRSE